MAATVDAQAGIHTSTCPARDSGGRIVKQAPAALSSGRFAALIETRAIPFQWTDGDVVADCDVDLQLPRHLATLYLEQ